MSEENNNQPQIETDDSVSSGPKVSTMTNPRRIALLASAILTFVVVAGALYWALSGREGGKTVSPPTSVTFGDSTTTSGETAEGETLTIPADQVDRIGVKIETVGETLSAEAMSVASTGVVRSNEYRETPVYSLVGGVVRKINIELGDTVGRGQTIAVLESDELAMAQATFLTAAAEVDEADKRYERAIKLTDIAPESRNELDQATAAVKIAEAEHAEHISHFARTEKLVKIGAASRQDYEMARSMHETAAAKLEEAWSRLDRAKRLLVINPQRRAELDAALTQKRSTDAKAAAEQQRLIVLGMSTREVNALRSTRRVSSELAIRSPISGTVTSRMVNAGEIITANKEAARITDLSDVWVIAQVYEKDLAQLREGSGASVTTDAFPGRLFRGHVTYIDPNIDQSTRTAQVRIEMDNPGRILKLGMYVNVALGSQGAAERTMPEIPSSAVQDINERKVVFAATDKPNVFAVRTVRLGADNNGRFVVLEGLNVGDRIITEGSFLLRAELLKRGAAN